MSQAGRQTTSEEPDTMGQTERHEFEYRGTNELEDIRRAGHHQPGDKRIARDPESRIRLSQLGSGIIRLSRHQKGKPQVKRQRAGHQRPGRQMNWETVGILILLERADTS